MSHSVIQAYRLLSIILFVLLVQACGSLPQLKEVYTTETKQQSLESILKQAQTASPDEKNQLWLKAAGLLNLEKRFEKSQELLVRIDKSTLPATALDDYYLYLGEALLALNSNENALKQLNSVVSSQSKPIEWQIRYSQTLSDCYLANGNYFEAAKQRIELDDLISDAELLASNHEKIWFALNQLESDFIQQQTTDFNSRRVNGWLEIAYINKRWGHHPEKLVAEIDLWKSRYPLHPSSVHQPEALERTTTGQYYNPRKVAVLLPLSGKRAKIGELIQDGILAAYFSYDDIPASLNNNPQGQQPTISFYDTAKHPTILTPYQQALSDGADFILGPLTKESLQQINHQESHSVPILALNRLPDYTNAHPNFYQFGLPIEDEAVQLAHRAYEKGYRKAIALFPNNRLGERAKQAFKEYFDELGGELVESRPYTSNLKALKPLIADLLGTNRSLQRKKRLQQLLGKNIEFEMRRRQDTDVVFVVAEPNLGIAIKPLIDSYYGQDLPIMATSSIFSGKNNPKFDNDLNRIEFPDIPLLLSEKDNFQQTRQWLSEIKPNIMNARARYFALGFDSFSMLRELAMLKAFANYRWNGLSGELSVDNNGFIRRHLTWAEFERGVPKVTKEREAQTTNTGSQ
jgi:outer membrane PBP1 activator LpoA protein